MSGTVNFQNIPPNLKVPLFWVETSNSQAGANTQAQRVLIVGGSLNPIPSVPIWVPPPAGKGATGAAQAVAAQTGQGSMLATMMGKYRQNDAFTEVWILPVPDPVSAVAATAQTAITGTPSTPQLLTDYIGGQVISLLVLPTQTANTIARRLADAANAIPALAATATNAGGVVTYTAKHKGLLGNQLDHRLNYLGARSGEATPAGLSVSITGFSGGAGNPTIAPLLDALGPMEFDFIISGFNDAVSLAALTTFMSDAAGRWSYVNQLYGGTFSAQIDTPPTLQILGGALNDQHQTIIGGTGSPTPYWDIAAAVMGVAVQRIIAQPNIPLDGLVVQGVQAPADGNGYDVSTQQTLLTRGISPLTWDRSGACHITRLITTYQVNTFGVSDNSYFDVGVLYTIMAVLRRLKASATQRLAQKLIVDDATPIGSGQPAISPRVERMNIYHDYLRMQSDLLVENADAFLAGLVVTRNANDPTRMDVLFDPHLISGLHIYAVLNQFYLRAA